MDFFVILYYTQIMFNHSDHHFYYLSIGTLFIFNDNIYKPLS